MLPPSLQSSLPAGWLAFTGRELNPLDRYKRFQITFPSSFSGFVLAQGKFHFEPPFTSFDHLVGGDEYLVGHSEAEHPGRLGVDDEFELAGLDYGQVRGLGAFEDAAGIDTELAKRIYDVGSITHQPANFDKESRRIDRRKPVERRQLDHLDMPGSQESVGPHEQGIGPIAPDILEGGIYLAAGGGVE